MPDTYSVDIRHLAPPTCVDPGVGRVLVELSKMEQRYDAVLGALRDGYRFGKVGRGVWLSGIPVTL
jgi:hypothetical protein